MNGYWRDRARPIIARVLLEHASEGERVIRHYLREAYPFGLRQYYPYKVWCDEVARQMGRKPPLGTRHAIIAQERNPAQAALPLGAP